MAFSSVARKRMVVLLPAPFGTDEAEHLAGLDLQVQLIDGQQIVVAFCEIYQFDHLRGMVLSLGGLGSSAFGGNDHLQLHEQQAIVDFRFELSNLKLKTVYGSSSFSGFNVSNRGLLGG